MSKKSSKGRRRTAWMPKELLAKLRQKKEIYIEHRERGRPLEKHIGMLSEYERMQQGRLRSIQN